VGPYWELLKLSDIRTDQLLEIARSALNQADVLDEFDDAVNHLYGLFRQVTKLNKEATELLRRLFEEYSEDTGRSPSFETMALVKEFLRTYDI
jgi:hypothetical protein